MDQTDEIQYRILQFLKKKQKKTIFLKTLKENETEEENPQQQEPLPQQEPPQQKEPSSQRDPPQQQEPPLQKLHQPETSRPIKRKKAPKKLFTKQRRE